MLKIARRNNATRAPSSVERKTLSHFKLPKIDAKIITLRSKNSSHLFVEVPNYVLIKRNFSEKAHLVLTERKQQMTLRSKILRIVGRVMGYALKAVIKAVIVVILLYVTFGEFL
jgi:hypothetical protein